MEKETKEIINANGNDLLKSNGKLSAEEKIKGFIDKNKFYIIRVLEAKWKLVLINCIAASLTILYLIFLAKPYYESSITILPEYGSKSSMLGQLSSLAAMAGVNVGDAAPTEIYQNILLSESVLKPVIFSKYITEKSKDSLNLIEYFEIEADENNISKELKQRKMFLKMYNAFVKDKIHTSTDRLTKILTVSVEMPESRLSADVVNNIASSLDQYIRTQRRSYSSEQRYYIEKRVAQVSDSLRLAENKLKNFSEKNRIVAQSPQLMLEQARLMRTVEILQSVYVELTKQLEIAKIDEIKDAPVLNIKEAANDPIEKKGPKRFFILFVVLGLVSVSSTAYLMFLPEIKKYKNLIKL